MIWYKTQYDGTLKEIEVEKETDKFIFVENYRKDGFDRVQKKASYANYFKTKKEAVDFMIKEAESKKLVLENSLKALKNFIEKVKNDNPF